MAKRARRLMGGRCRTSSPSDTSGSCETRASHPIREPEPMQAVGIAAWQTVEHEPPCATLHKPHADANRTMLTNLLMAALGAAIGVIVATLWRNGGAAQRNAGTATATCATFTILDYDQNTCTASLDVFTAAPTAFFALRVPTNGEQPDPAHPPWEDGRWYPGATGQVQLPGIPVKGSGDACTLYVWAVCLNLQTMSPVSCDGCGSSPTPPGSGGSDQLA